MWRVAFYDVSLVYHKVEKMAFSFADPVTGIVRQVAFYFAEFQTLLHQRH